MTVVVDRGGGNCYEAALVLLMFDEVPDDAVLCHGKVTGGGPVAGMRFGHAWVELADGTVIDRSNGNDVTMDKERYYAIGQIREDEVRRYEKQEAFMEALRTEVYGPWEEEE